LNQQLPGRHRAARETPAFAGLFVAAEPFQHAMHVPISTAYRWGAIIPCVTLPPVNASNEKVDEFGLPDSAFGRLPDWFFPAVGRVVAVSALLENKAQVLAETLANYPQDTLTLTTSARVRKIGVEAAAQIDAANSASAVDPIGSQVGAFFDEVVDLLDRRNSVVHAIWPAQAGEEQFGWRPPRRAKDNETRITADNTRARLTDLIRRKADLIQAWNNLHGTATHARLRAADGGYHGLPLDPKHRTT